MLPAHKTKHVRQLDVKIGSSTFKLNQSDAGDTNGTALWLGGQLLSAYLLHLHTTGKLHRSRSSVGSKPRAIEVGSGIGLCGLALASLGIDTVVTDVPLVLPLLRQNINQNAACLPSTAGTIQVRELDWTVLPEQWSWSDPARIASRELDAVTQTPESIEESICPPFDYILTADTLYTNELVTPLLRSLHHLVLLSSVTGKSAPRAFIALERRDPALITAALAEATETWGFACDRVPPRKIAKAMEKAGLKWDKEDWDDVEIWTLTLAKDRKV